MLAQLTACVVNFSMGAPKKPVAAADLMPSQWAKQKPKQKDRRDPRLIDNEFEGCMRALVAQFAPPGPAAGQPIPPQP